MNQSKWANLSKNLLFLAEFFLVLLVPWGSHSVHAQEQSEVKLAAQAGLDGYCKEGTWIPIHVTMENVGTGVDGYVQVSYLNANGGTSTYGQAISLPTTSRKDLFLYFYPPQYIRNLKVTFVASNQVVAEEKLALSCVGAENMLFGVMSDDPAAYEILNDVKPLDGFVRVAHFRPADLPDRPQGWVGLDALIVADVDTGTLTKEQRESLSAWLANGGKLMVIGGSTWQGTAAGLLEFLPVDFTSTRTVFSLSQLESYFQSSASIEGEALLAVGAPRKDANVLVEQNGVPLLVEREVGFGKVIFLAADPTLRPLSEWEGMRNVYDSLLSTKPVRPDWINQQRWDVYTANRAISTLDELGIPPIVSVCGWLFLYVLVIGPVNFFFLRWSKRRDMAWLTIPALAIVFSSIAYFYGSIYRGQHPILNRIAVIHAWDTSPVTDVRAVVGLYSPRRTKYTIETNTQFMFYPFQDNASNVPGNSDWLNLNEGEGAVMPDVPVEIGGMRTFSMQGNLPALRMEHDFIVAIGNGDPILKGTISNLSDQVLHDAVLFSPGEWKKLGDIAPGYSENVELRLTPNATGPEFYNLDAYQILDPGTQIYGEDKDRIRREAILDMILNSSGLYYGNYGNWGVYLMGWLDQPLLPVSVQGETSDSIDTALYILKLTPSVRYESTRWTLTPGVMAWEASMPNASPYYGNEVVPGGYILRFRPAVPVPFDEVERLTLNVNTISGALPSDASVSLWSFEIAQWERVPNLIWGMNEISEPARFVGPGGETRLKIDSLSNYSIQVSPANVTLVVNP